VKKKEGDRKSRKGAGIEERGSRSGDRISNLKPHASNLIIPSVQSRRPESAIKKGPQVIKSGSDPFSALLRLLKLLECDIERAINRLD